MKEEAEFALRVIKPWELQLKEVILPSANSVSNFFKVLKHILFFLAVN